MNPPNEFYVWGPFDSRKNFNRDMWSRFEVAIYAGRWVWRERARCRLCGKLVGWSGCSGNLKKHLERNHPETELTTTEKTKKEVAPMAGKEFGANSGEGRGPVRKFDRWLIPGNLVRLRKHKTWNYFYQECLPNGKCTGCKWVTCILCGRDMAWNGKGLAKLNTHLRSIHGVETT